MPAIKFGNVTNVQGAAEELGGFYSGPAPKEKTAYSCYVQSLELKTNKNTEPMVVGLAIVDFPKSHKLAKFNGFGIWFQQNVTDQGKPFVNQMLNGLSDGTEEQSAKIRKAFWTGGCVTKDPLPSKASSTAGPILRIGPLKLTDLEDKKIRVILFCKPDTDNKGNDILTVMRYIMKEVESDDEYDEEEYDETDDDEADDDESDPDEDEDGESDDEDEEDDEYDEEDDDSDGEGDDLDTDDDEDPEPEPEVVTPIKKATKKVAAKKTSRKEPAF
jgi:hypothetical protein